MLRFIIATLLLPFLLSCGMIGAPETAHERDASVVNIRTAYTHADSHIFTGLYQKSHIAVTKNTLTSEVAICANTASAAACTNQITIPGGTVLALDEFGLSGNVYMISNTGADITTGEIDITVW